MLLVAVGVAGCSPPASKVPLGGKESPPPSEPHYDKRAQAKSEAEQPAAAPSAAAPAAATASLDASTSAAAAQPSTPEPAVGFVFAERQPTVGDKTRTQTTMTMSGVGFGATIVEVTREECLEVTSAKMTKLRLEVFDSKLDANLAGQPQHQDLPLAGKNFVISVQGNQLVLQQEGGGSLSDEARRDLEKRYDRLLPDDARQHLKGAVSPLFNQPLQIGDKVVLSEEQMARWLGQLPSGVADIDIELELRDVRSVAGIESGVFDVRGSAGFTDKGMEMLVHPRGHLAIALAGGFATDIDIQGDVELKLLTLPLFSSGSSLALDIQSSVKLER